jgi:hypothetical protein
MDDVRRIAGERNARRDQAPRGQSLQAVAPGLRFQCKTAEQAMRSALHVGAQCVRRKRQDARGACFG